ncbi:BREX-1 system adenine-specific DNA-methyltransferase PglX [Thiohalocapsa halophila]|uniref:BREX-1 system adenine-specific DNA-methyltransferase PglX n=1 Tax=Thiohalocapsa halophila TaxID=69359 RepID=UPI001F5B5AC8|nr:BREX-1 system adenine-specific DNA-methyltransferase PglX [Thiohalocapsa halophila]
MLFARFLAENGLLMHPDGVPLTLDECNELARDEGAADGWELAGRYASRMLPQIFRPDSPVLALTLAPEHQRALEHRLAGLHPDTFQASDSLGWVYQFWQTKRKDAVNRSEVKIGADELPAVTQLFTEPYMVAFLLDNSLGAWWAARRLSAEDLRTAESEEVLRRKATIPGVPLEYLRFVKDEDETWTPAAGTFDAWPEHLSELKVMDPCCGSGHFLVAAFQMLVPMRMALEGLSAREAVDAVLRENLHGLELDQRCVELAAFALALTAWRWPDAGGHRPLPTLNLACSGLGIHASKADWLQLAEGDVDLQHALERIYELFQDAPTLGSLIDPRRAFRDDDLIDLGPQRGWERVAPLVERALASEDEQQRELGVVAAGLARAAQLLADRYQCVITNVPYLTRGKQQERLRDFCERHHAEAKNDLATVFLKRCLGLCVEGGTTSVVLPQNWLFLTSYRKLREKLLKQECWHLLARLGGGAEAFENGPGNITNICMTEISRGNPKTESGDLFRDAEGGSLMRGLDVSEYRNASEKADRLLGAEVKSVEQVAQLSNPDNIISFEISPDLHLLGEYVDSIQGLGTSDNPPFVRFFWELEDRKTGWEWLQSAPDHLLEYRGLQLLIRWEDGKGLYYKHAMALKKERRLGGWKSGKEAWGSLGVSVSEMGDLPATYYLGTMYDNTAHAVIPKSKAHLAAIWCFFYHKELSNAVREKFQSLKVTNHTLKKVPFDLDHWSRVAAEQYPNGLPNPYSDDPTQWIFHGHPCGSVTWDEETKWTAIAPKRTNDAVLQTAVARLLGYRWPAETDEAMELSDESRTLVAEARKLEAFSDDDGICCLPPIRGEPAAHERLLRLLEAAYADDWSAGTLGKLLAESGAQGKGLDVWLRDAFFQQHCKLFHHRPFIWHIWDGLKDGFAALVNYHKLDRANLERLVYTYLGDWIRMQERAGADGQQGADERLAAAKGLKAKLEAILEGEAPLDIFVRWKPIKQQPIGWEPDLNDGVRLNIRPFMLADDVSKKGAGVLRAKPDIHWK